MYNMVQTGMLHLTHPKGEMGNAHSGINSRSEPLPWLRALMGKPRWHFMMVG